MTDLSRFTEAHWKEAERNLLDLDRQYQVGWDLQAFKEWLGIEENIDAVRVRYGEEWALSDAVVTIFDRARTAKVDERREQALKGGRKKRASRGVGLRPMRSLDEPSGESTVYGEGDEPPDANAPSFDSLDPAEYERMFAERLREYQDRYVDRTPNDDASLDIMINAEVTMRMLIRIRTAAMMSTRPDSAMIARLTHSIKELSDQFAALQDKLGIGRAQRERKQESASDSEKILAAIDDAGAWIEKQSIRVEHCGVLLGLYVTQFREVAWHIKGMCPRCGQEFEATHEPTEEDQLAHEPAWVAEEEEEYKKRELAKAMSEFEQQVTGDDE
jgi:hypothetical protein